MKFSSTTPFTHSDPAGNTPTLQASEMSCTASSSSSNAQCVATFLFQNYTANATGTLDLKTGENIRLGNGSGANFVPYFEINNAADFPDLTVTQNQAYSGIQITWMITIP
ncbi:hypothetical protein HRbin04_00734 [archaeon HR04]|nr:hypothetical protein HRbin04_00734 [archaeon HR04]